MKAIVVIPTFNERENISRLLPKVQEVVKNISGWRVEILVVDDNSPDGTAGVVRRLAEKSKNIHLHLRKKREGLGAAYLAGMRYAFGKFSADVVLTMDADLSHNPTSIPYFLQKVKDGTQFVIGSRYIPGGSIPYNWPQHRKLLSVFGNKIVPVMLGSYKFTDWTSGFRAIKKEVFHKVSPQLTDSVSARGYTFNISFAYHTAISGFKIAEVPINFPDRTRGESKLGFEYLLHTPIFLFKTRLGMLLRGKVKI